MMTGSDAGWRSPLLCSSIYIYLYCSIQIFYWWRQFGESRTSSLGSGLANDLSFLFPSSLYYIFYKIHDFDVLADSGDQARR